jgi:two-component system response regulator HydG
MDGRSILLVDDDREFCKAFRRGLEGIGYTVTAVHDGLEALEALSQSDFDLIISDLRMPNLDGMELMRELIKRELDVPVVFLTAFGEVESYMDLMNMGAHDYLSKPVKLQTIRGVIERVLEKREDP